MGDDLSSKTALVIDQGLCGEVARRLARDFGKVKYYRHWEDNLPVAASFAVGNGFPEVERIKYLFEHIDSADLIVFPDVFHPDWQIEFEKRGKRVWGSRYACRLETDRIYFKKTLKDVKLPVNPFTVVKGVEALIEHCKEHEDCWIKISEYRGDGETWHHKNYRLSQCKLDALRYWYGPLGTRIQFIVEPTVDTEIEVAYDGFSIHGQYPKMGIQGYEVKDKSYIATFQKCADMPEQVQAVNEAIAPILKKHRYANWWGTEIRVDDQGTGFFTDATTRFPMPPGELTLEAISNISEVFWHGAVGDMVELEIEKPFAVQAEIYSHVAYENWLPLEIPDKIKRWVKFIMGTNPNGPYIAPERDRAPNPSVYEPIGSVVALGDTIEEAIATLKEHAAQLDGFDIDIKLDALAENLQVIHAAEEQGIEFTSDTVPEPSVVLESE